MGLMAAVAGAGMYSVGKGLLKSFLKRSGGNMGRELIKARGRAGGFLRNTIPVVGDINLMARSVKGIPSFLKDRSTLKAAHAVNTRRLDATLSRETSLLEHSRWNVASLVNMKSIKNSTMVPEMVHDQILNFAKSLKHNPRTHVKNMQTAWSGYLRDNRITAKVDLSQKILDPLSRVQLASEHAMASRELIGTQLASNMAVVGMPSLARVVATVSIAKYMWNKTGNKLRGYNRQEY